MEKNKQITHYHITSHESGIVELLITTQDRWLDYHRYDDNWYSVFDIGEQQDEEHLKVELPLRKDMRYMSASTQNKDQITFYYIPYPLVMEKNKWDRIKANLT